MNKSILPRIRAELALATVFLASNLLRLEGADQAISLFNGRDLSGWRQPTGTWSVVGKAKLNPTDPAKFKVEPGYGVLVNNPERRTVNLLSQVEHGDVQAQVEFMVPKDSNSGVYLEGRYEVQILDSWGKEHPTFGDCGGIYERWANGKGFEGRAPRLNASRPPGQWQTFDILFRAPRFDATGKKIENARFVKVVHNGKVIHENVEVSGPTRAAAFDDERPTGPLMLQGDHLPVAFRKVVLKPARLP